MVLSRSARYLGVILGLEPHKTFWDAALTKFRQRAMALPCLEKGLHLSARVYVYISSVLSFLAQFATPSAHVLAAESCALYRFARAPANMDTTC